MQFNFGLYFVVVNVSTFKCVLTCVLLWRTPHALPWKPLKGDSDSFLEPAATASKNVHLNHLKESHFS